MKIILVVIVAICQALITSIPIYNKKLSDNRSKFPKNLTNAGRWMLALIVITIISTMTLFSVSESDQRKFQTTLNDTLRNRDIRHERREDELSHSYTKQIDSSYKKSSQSFNEVVLKYGLHFDSLNNKLVKGIEIDSSKKQNFIQKMSPPELYLDTIKVSLHANNMKRVTFYFKNQKDEAKNGKINLYIMVVFNGEFIKGDNPQTIDIDQLLDNKTLSMSIDFLHSDIYSYKTYFFFFDGGYYDKNLKFYPFNNLSEINADNYKLSQPNGDHRLGVMGLFKKLFPEIKS